MLKVPVKSEFVVHGPFDYGRTFVTALTYFSYGVALTTTPTLFKENKEMLKESLARHFWRFIGAA